MFLLKRDENRSPKTEGHISIGRGTENDPGDFTNSGLDTDVKVGEGTRSFDIKVESDLRR